MDLAALRAHGIDPDRMAQRVRDLSFVQRVT
jgi:hypothetical protein